MFPIRDVAGSVIGFGGRVLPSSAARRRVQQTGEEAGSTSRTYFDPPKYINSPTTSGDALMSRLICLLMRLFLDMMVMRMRLICMMIMDNDVEDDDDDEEEDGRIMMIIMMMMIIIIMRMRMKVAVIMMMMMVMMMVIMRRRRKRRLIMI
jgi:hypothetical protein